MDFAIGQMAGDYEVLAVLGVGGMGKVYKVRNTISDRIDAMKVLLTRLDEHPDLVERFGREIKVTASLEHPNIAALRTAQRIGDQMAMVMEFVEGSTLDSLMRAGRLPVAQSLDSTHQALAALAYAHSRGVVHRDIKPANIMLTPDGRVKLMDFGIARMTADRSLTKTGQMVGSLYYMSPEQAEGKQLDARSDIYSLGVTLYEMVTGQKPFQGDSDYAILAGHLHQPPRPPVELDPSVPAALNEIILMTLAKEPEGRFQTADAFGNALASVAASLGIALTPISDGSGSSHRGMAPLVDTVATPAISVPPPPPPQPIPAASAPVKSGHARALWMVAGALAALLVLALAVMYLPKWRQANAAQNQPPPAPTPAQIAETTPPAAAQASPVPEAPAPPTSPAPEKSPAPKPERQSPMPAHSAPVRSSPPATQPSPSQPSQDTAPPPVQPPPVQPTAAPPQTAPQDDAALEKLHDDLNMLATRVGAVNTSLDNLQRSQAAQGFGLRGDIVASRKRMELLMDQTENNINRGNAPAAKKSLAAAEAEVEKLEAFLGR